MARYVIDARTLLHLLSTGAAIDEGHQVVAPNLIRSQVLDLLLRAVRDGELSEELALEQLELLAEFKMRLLGDRVSRRTSWRIATEQGWKTTFDAEFFAVTLLQADAFVTIDPAMAEKAAAVVPLAKLDALTG